MALRARAWIGTLAALAASASCGEKSPVAKPDAPDMAPLVESYAHPTLVLDLTNLQNALDLSVSVAGTVQTALDLVPQVKAAVHVGLNADSESDQIGSSGDDSTKPLGFTGSGFLRVHRICPGNTPGAGPDEANGSIDLTVGFTEKGIDPVVWGGFAACQFPLDSEPSLIQGTLQLYVGDSLPFDAFGTQPLLIAIAGDLTTSGVAAQLNVDFRLMPTGGFEYRVFVGDKHVIYWDDLEHRGFRDATGTWTCQFDTKLCAKNEDGQQLAW